MYLSITSNIGTSVGNLEIPSLVRLGLQVVSETSPDNLSGGTISEITIRGTASKLNAFLQDVWFVPDSNWHSDRTRLIVQRNDEFEEYTAEGSLNDVIEVRVQHLNLENIVSSRIELRALSSDIFELNGTFFLSVECSSEVIHENDTSTGTLTPSINLSSVNLENDLLEAIESALSE